MPEIHTFRVDTASSLAFVQFLRIVTATANPEYLSSIIVNNLIGSISLPDSAPLLQALPNLHSLSLDGLHSAEILQRDLAGAFPRLHTLTVAGLIMMESTTTSTWASLRNVAACPIPSVQELVLRFALEGRRLDPPMAVLDGDIRYALRALDWTLLDGVLSVYKDVALEFELDRPSLAISQAQMADTLRLVESVARDRMSARARQSVHLRVYWKVPSTDPHDT
ncbi:hypothetical protein PsYK624_107720 [Phanerochaete sordida]|uniref:Uncharacterized protein n=1 Tax=Phanerochaete sordida TaxID=48140 RepID=A0A9P3LHX7_9APHY|nr:hypothetical protein PsYK624_107720 [Phanerochaete sordida]